MANVLLRKMWFAPGGQRWRAGQYLDFPDHMLEFLPKDSVINDGSGPKRAEDWRGDRKGKKDVDLIEATKTFTPNTSEGAEGTALPDPGDPKHNAGPVGDEPKAAAGQGESESPASPKSSGPNTTALPGINKEGQATTASGTTPKEKAEQAAAAAAKPK